MSNDQEKQDPQSPAARLKALRDARAAREEEHAKAEADAKLELDIENEQAIADAEAKHGPIGRGIAVIPTRLGVVIVKAPNHMLVRKFRDKPNSTTSDSWGELIVPCLVHPTPERYDHILEKQNGVLAAIGMAVLGLAGLGTEELTGKS